MPGDRMSVPVVVRAAGPKFETDTAEHLLRHIYLPDGVHLSLDGRGDAVRIAVVEREEAGAFSVSLPRVASSGMFSSFRLRQCRWQGRIFVSQGGKCGIMGNFVETISFCMRLL